MFWIYWCIFSYCVLINRVNGFDDISVFLNNNSSCILDTRQQTKINNTKIDKIINNLTIPKIISTEVDKYWNINCSIVLLDDSIKEIDVYIDGVLIYFTNNTNNRFGNYGIKTITFNIQTADILTNIPNKKNFNGEILRIGIINYPPFILYLHEDDVIMDKDIKLNDKLIQNLHGIEYELLRHFIKRYNFTMDAKLRVEDELWGVLYPNGTTSGLFKKVQDNELDLAVGGFNCDFRYLSSVHLTVPHTNTRVKFLSPRKEAIRNWLSFLIKPFEIEIWFAIITVLILSAITLYWSQYNENNHHIDVSLTVLISLSVFVQQGVTKRWLKGIKRWLLVNLQISVLLLSACYCGLLVSVLTLEPIADQLDTIQQLAKSGLHYTDTDDIFPGQLILSEDPNIKNIMKRYKISKTWPELINHLINKDTIFTVECLDSNFLCLQNEIDTNILKDLYLSRDYVLTSAIAIMTNKKFKLKRELDLEILELIQSGIIKKWENNVLSIKPYFDMNKSQQKKLIKKSNNPNALSLFHLYGPFLLLLYGLLFSLILFLLEIFYNYYNICH